MQVAVNEGVGMTFMKALRSFLRQDPDIIMLGEMRDLETSQIAIQASLTGHLVLSTLHTNDAPGAVTRLLDMGLEPFLITSTVHGVLAQRLIRRVCPSCRVERPITDQERQVLSRQPTGDQVLTSLVHAPGCAACNGLGYQGRLGLYELMVLDEAIRGLVLQRQPISAIRQAARAQGMRTLREDGIAKVVAGETTLEEVMRETQDYE